MIITIACFFIIAFLATQEHFCILQATGVCQEKMVRFFGRRSRQPKDPMQQANPYGGKQGRPYRKSDFSIGTELESTDKFDINIPGTQYGPSRNLPPTYEEEDNWDTRSLTSLSSITSASYRASQYYLTQLRQQQAAKKVRFGYKPCGCNWMSCCCCTAARSEPPIHSATYPITSEQLDQPAMANTLEEVRDPPAVTTRKSFTGVGPLNAEPMVGNSRHRYAQPRDQPPHSRNQGMHQHAIPVQQHPHAVPMQQPTNAAPTQQHRSSTPVHQRNVAYRTISEAPSRGYAPSLKSSRSLFDDLSEDSRHHSKRRKSWGLLRAKKNTWKR